MSLPSLDLDSEINMKSWFFKQWLLKSVPYFPDVSEEQSLPPVDQSLPGPSKIPPIVLSLPGTSVSTSTTLVMPGTSKLPSTTFTLSRTSETTITAPLLPAATNIPPLSLHNSGSSEATPTTPLLPEVPPVEKEPSAESSSSLPAHIMEGEPVVNSDKPDEFYANLFERVKKLYHHLVNRDRNYSSFNELEFEYSDFGSNTTVKSEKKTD